MDIDLLFTETGEAGLICSKVPAKKAVGVLFDPQTGILTLEYADMDHLEMNIHVEEDYAHALDQVGQLHLGAVVNDEIAQAYQVPIMFLDDPYRGDALGQVDQSPYPLQAFDFFVKRCMRGQAVNRDDLGDESSMGCVLGDASPSSLQFAPHLARKHAMEVAPKAAPSGPGPSSPGLGGGGGGRVIRRSGDD